MVCFDSELKFRFAKVLAAVYVNIAGSIACLGATAERNIGVASASNGLEPTACACDYTVTTNLKDAVSHRYLAVDISAGSSASRYPIGWLDSVPKDGWGDEYKTTMIVLRRILPGGFIMGEDKTDVNHRVRLTKPYYIGVFEITQRQWELVMGTRPSEFKEDYEKRPVEEVSYDMIRGSNLGAKWPKSDDVDAESFLGVLRRRTGLDFDLPTETQWEYACSARSESKYSYGSVADGRFMWHHDNSDGQTHDVGLKLPNKWGLYDMHGNVSEWCLNRNSPLWYCTDPRGFSVGLYRMRRGGDWYAAPEDCETYSRVPKEPSLSCMFTGFRLLLGNITIQ